jgi:hypothetical protein
LNPNSLNNNINIKTIYLKQQLSILLVHKY